MNIVDTEYGLLRDELDSLRKRNKELEAEVSHLKGGLEIANNTNKRRENYREENKRLLAEVERKNSQVSEFIYFEGHPDEYVSQGEQLTRLRDALEQIKANHSKRGLIKRICAQALGEGNE